MPTKPFAALLDEMSPERRARIAESAKALREADARRKAEYVNEAAAARYIEMPVARLRQTRLAGTLPGCLCKRVGRALRYRVGDLDDFVDAHGMDR